ncbi:MAG: CBS domain-containing protein [Myxococcales bacterium]|nr:CBS domain-containing protein [Myxococcales bacterium]
MDVNARTVAEETDLLQIAGIFMNTNYRRLPVLHEDRLVGQISRRDVLSALHKQLTSSKRPEQALLYLSALGEPPSFSR